MTVLVINFLILNSFLFFSCTTGWKNGPAGSEFSSNPEEPKYGTHDWIAEHALDWLDVEEKQYILDNLATYLYGTELPDKTTGPDGIGDMVLQHVFYNETAVLKNDSGCRRAKEEHALAVEYIENGDLYNGTLHLGIMTHYIADLAVFGNVMNETYWGVPTHYEDYMNYVNSEMSSYNSVFNSYLNDIGILGIDTAYNAALLVAFNTTFNPRNINPFGGGNRTCTWMDANYDWLDPEFKDRCGESLNYAVNNVAEMLYITYNHNLSTPEKPKNLKIEKVSGNAINLSWSPNTEKNIAGYSLFINNSGSSTEFEDQPIVNVTSGNAYSVTNLNSETTYYFKLRAYSVVGKISEFSDIVHGTTLDITPPDAPSILPLPEITNKPQLAVSGFAEKNAEVEIYLDNNFTSSAGSTTASLDLGFYRIEITLNQGENNITARAFDSRGNPSALAPYKLVYMDAVAPRANAGADIDVEKREAPVRVRFDGRNSTDDSGIIENYTWTLDLKAKLVTLFGTTPEYYFDKVGDFIVTLNVTDRINNWATDKLWVNVTQLDYLPPTIVSRNPGVDAVNQSVNTTIKAKFNEPLNASTINIRLISMKDGELQIPRPSYDLSKLSLTLKPFSNLTHEDTYTVIITAEDLAGNQLIGGRWNFSTVQRPPDFDGDQIPDIWEWSHGLDANESDSRLDPDSDGLENIDEYNDGIKSTDPHDPDTDDDGMSDYFERLYSLNPLLANDSGQDADGDGLTNLEEFERGSNPLDPNSPGDREDGGEPSEEDFTWYIVIIIIIILVIIILVFMLRKLQYKQTNKIIRDDDGYLKTEDAKELGIGGNIFLESPGDYTFEGKAVKPGFRGPSEQDKTAAAYSAQGPISDRPTPAEILKRAKESEKKCSKCGAGLPKDTNYCFECGEVFKKD
ncbi:Ig-like domain-containing protein [[Eubacterium] cellulosolvens]